MVDRRGGGVIIDLGGGNIYIEPDVPDDDRLLYDADNVEVQELEGGRTRTIVYRRNGVQIVTVRDRYGDIIRRVKVLPDGRQIVLIDNRFPEDYDPRRQRILRDVPPPIIGIPQDQYVVDLGEASYDDIRGALLAPPVQGMERRYTLDEVLRNESVRAYSPRIDLDTITFEFGSSTIGNDQMRSIFELGQALEDVLARASRRGLSDRRAHRPCRQQLRQPDPVGPPQRGGRRRSVAELRYSAGEPHNPRLRRGIPEGRDGRSGAAQSARHGPPCNGASASAEPVEP